MSSKGQTLLNTIVECIGGYMAMPREWAIVCALYVLMTWQFKLFDAVPYLCICAATKQSGKSVLLETMSMLSFNAWLTSDPTASVLYRKLDTAPNGMLTIAIDEAETLSAEGARTLRSIMNSGYRKGATIPRTMPDGSVKDFPCFGPKMFALIGDVNDTLRDRSIVLWLSRGVPAKRYRRSIAEREASAIVPQIEAFWKQHESEQVTAVYPDWLQGRDEEIWESLISLAHFLKLDAATMDLILRASADLTGEKTGEARDYRRLKAADSDKGAVDIAYGERALRDLASVLDTPSAKRSSSGPTGDIHSAEAVKRMRDIATGPWRTFRGVGLNENTLADLLSRFGVHTRNVAMERGKGKKLLKGYRGTDVLASVSTTQTTEGN